MSTLRSIVRSLLVVPLLFAATHAFAATTSSTISITSPTPSSITVLNPFTVNVPQFNPSLGTLTGATISLTLSDVQLLVYAGASSNFNPITGTRSYTYSTPYTISLLAVDVVLSAPDDTSFPLVDSNLQAKSVFATVPTTPYTGTSPADSTTKILAGSFDTAIPEYDYTATQADLSALTGTGTVPLGYDADVYLYAFGQQTGVDPTMAIGSATGSEMITYTYTPNAVPEPASLALLGLTSPLLLRRRRS